MIIKIPCVCNETKNIFKKKEKPWKSSSYCDLWIEPITDSLTDLFILGSVVRPDVGVFLVDTGARLMRVMGVNILFIMWGFFLLSSLNTSSSLSSERRGIWPKRTKLMSYGWWRSSEDGESDRKRTKLMRCSWWHSSERRGIWPKKKEPN